MRKVKQGEQMNKETLYLENEKLVYHMLNKMHIDKNCFDYEDVVAEAKLGLWLAINGGYKEGKSNFSTYACNAIKNQVCKYLNTKHVRTATTFRELGTSLDSVIGDNENSFLADIIPDDRVRRDFSLKIYLEELKEKFKNNKCVQVFFDFFNGMSRDELNAKYNLTSNAYCSYVDRGKKILKEYVKKDLNITQKEGGLVWQ